MLIISRYYWENIMIVMYTLTFLITPTTLIISDPSFVQLKFILYLCHFTLFMDIIMTFITGNINNSNGHLTDMSFSSVAK